MHDGFHELSGHAVRRMRGLRALSTGWLVLGLLLSGSLRGRTTRRSRQRPDA